MNKLHEEAEEIRAETAEASPELQEHDRVAELEQALTALHAGRAREVLAMLTALTARHPDGRVFHSTLARALQDAGDPRAALAVHRRIVARWPDDAMVFHDLAAAARAAGDAAEAVRARIDWKYLLGLELADPGFDAKLNVVGTLMFVVSIAMR